MQKVCYLLISHTVPFSSLFCFPHQEAKEQLSPLSAALEKLQQEKQELVERKRQRQEEGQEKVDTFLLLSLLVLSCIGNFIILLIYKPEKVFAQFNKQVTLSVMK